MPFTVVLDGKPGVGKTTQARLVAQELRYRGISAVGMSDCVRDHFFASGILRTTERIRKRDGGALELGTSYLLSVAAISYSYASALKKGFDVILLEGTPAMARAYVYAPGSDEERKKEIAAIYKIAGSIAKLFPLDLIVYLSASREALEERFKTRPDHRDAVHRSEVICDDKMHIDALRNHIGANNFVCIDSSGDRLTVAKAVTDSILVALERGR